MSQRPDRKLLSFADDVGRVVRDTVGIEVKVLLNHCLPAHQSTAGFLLFFFWPLEGSTWKHARFLSSFFIIMTFCDFSFESFCIYSFWPLDGSTWKWARLFLFFLLLPSLFPQFAVNTIIPSKDSLNLLLLSFCRLEVVVLRVLRCRRQEMLRDVWRCHRSKAITVLSGAALVKGGDDDAAV